MSDESFADYPKSISEIRSDTDGQAHTAKPRDVLVSVLREMDRGETAADALVVLWAKMDDKGGVETYYRVASPNALVTLGLLADIQSKYGAE